MKKLTDKEIQEKYKDVCEFGIDAMEGVNLFHAQQLLKYSQNIISDRLMEVNRSVASNPEIPIPDNFKGKDRMHDFWKWQLEYDRTFPPYHNIRDFIERNRGPVTLSEQDWVFMRIDHLRNEMLKDYHNKSVNDHDWEIKAILEKFKNELRYYETKKPDTRQNQFLIERLKKEIEKLEVTELAPKSLKKESPLKFEEMFTQPELIQDCIDILKKVEPPVLNQNEEYIGKYKGSFCVWIDKMNRKGLIYHYTDRTIYARLIGLRFAPFSIDASMFSKPLKRVEDLYQLEFDTLLSQVEQKGKLGK